MKVVNNNYPSIEQVAGQLLTQPTSVKEQPTLNGQTFADIFRQKQTIDNIVSPVRFSKHASVRLDDRNIELSSEQLSRLNEGAQKASFPTVILAHGFGMELSECEPCAMTFAGNGIAACCFDVLYRGECIFFIFHSDFALVQALSECFHNCLTAADGQADRETVSADGDNAEFYFRDILHVYHFLSIVFFYYYNYNISLR